MGLYLGVVGLLFGSLVLGHGSFYTSGSLVGLGWFCATLGVLVVIVAALVLWLWRFVSDFVLVVCVCCCVLFCYFCFWLGFCWLFVGCCFGGFLVGLCFCFACLLGVVVSWGVCF